MAMLKYSTMGHPYYQYNSVKNFRVSIEYRALCRFVMKRIKKLQFHSFSECWRVLLFNYLWTWEREQKGSSTELIGSYPKGKSNVLCKLIVQCFRYWEDCLCHWLLLVHILNFLFLCFTPWSPLTILGRKM